MPTKRMLWIGLSAPAKMPPSKMGMGKRQAKCRPVDRGISSVSRAARVCRRLRVTEVCRAAPGSRVRSEAGPCRRSASTARRAGGQSHDALFRSEAGLALPGSRGSAKAPARRARDAQPSRSVSHTPAALRSRVPSTPSMWNSVSLRMCFLPALPHPRQHCDVLAPMCIACALHTRSGAHSTPTLPPLVRRRRHGAQVERRAAPLEPRPTPRPS